MTRAEDSTTYDIRTGRVISKKRDNALSKALLKEAEKEANRLFNKFVKKGIYKEDEFDKFCVEYYLEGKHHE
jgi:hypothetical protein